MCVCVPELCDFIPFVSTMCVCVCVCVPELCDFVPFVRMISVCLCSTFENCLCLCSTSV